MQLMEKDLTVIIPAYNEGRTIKNVIKEVLKHPRVKEVIVVDDGSKDNTTYHIERFKDSIIFIKNEQNSGKGFSVRRALEHATSKYTIIQDADLELSPSSYDHLFKELELTGADMVNGRRYMGNGDVKLISKVASYLVPVTLFITHGVWVKDVVCCYKLMTTEKYKQLGLTSNRFELETEIILKAIRNRYKIIEREVTFTPRSVKEGKHIRWTDGIKVLRLILQSRFPILNNEKFRYLLTGGLSFGVEYISYFIFSRLMSVNLSISQFVSLILAAVINFLLTNFFTFQAGNKNLAKKSVMYTGLLLLNLALNNIIFNILVLNLGINDVLAKVATTVLILVWNFLIYKRFIFK